MSWIDRHSVNCRICGELVDERECVTPPDNEGSVCPDCVETAREQGILSEE